VANETLAAYYPTFVESLIASADQPLTPVRVEQFARALSERARNEGCEFIICYYVGHMFVNAGQRLALLQAGADDGEVERSIPQTDWTRGERGDAFLPLRELHGALGSAGLPFLLLVDGCMESKVVQTRLAEGGFVYDPMRPGTMIYQGPRELLTSEDARLFTATQADFGQTEPFLRGANPVSFAAKPGTFAVARNNPDVVGGPPVAPLAVSLRQWAELFILRDNRLPSMKIFLDRIVGFRGVGEVAMEGGISWSDFRTLDGITARLSPEGYLSRANASDAVIQRIPLNLGKIEDFARDPQSGTWSLLTKTVEPNGRNRWDIWQVPPTESTRPSIPPKRIVADVVFPKIACGNGSLFFYSDKNNHLFQWPFGARNQERVKGDFSFAELAAGHDGKSILALRADNTFGKGGDALLRFNRRSSEIVFTGELTQAKCIVERSAGKFAWLNSEAEGVIQFVTDGIKFDDVRVCDEELGGLAFAGEDLIAVNMPRTRLYRRHPSGAVAAAWLLDTEDRPIVDFHLGNGGMHSFGTDTWFASDRALFQVDLHRLDWQPIGDGN
jgi:hypothetical protein